MEVGSRSCNIGLGRFRLVVPSTQALGFRGQSHSNCLALTVVSPRNNRSYMVHAWTAICGIPVRKSVLAMDSETKVLEQGVDCRCENTFAWGWGRSCEGGVRLT